MFPPADVLVTKMVDVCEPSQPVEIRLDTRTNTLWVNVDGICVLRVCKMAKGVSVVMDEEVLKCAR